MNVKHIQFLCGFVTLALFSCSPVDGDYVEEVDFPPAADSAITLGPVLHDSLSSELQKQVKYVAHVFRHVENYPYEKWLEDFMREPEPDGEIAIWYRLAQIFAQFTKSEEFTIEEQSEVYLLLLLRSEATQEEIMSKFQFQHLTREKASALWTIYDEHHSDNTSL